MESRPAKHLRSALGQVVNFFYTLQGEAAGAQAFSNFDTLLAPFIRYDKLSYQEVKQALQEFIFNINVPTRVGFQTPFTNVTLDVNVPKHYAERNVIIGGEPKKETYGEFQEEMDLFNKAFLEVMAEGDAKGRVFTFPIPTYSITKDFDWDNPLMDGLWEMTAKYGVPYFSNFVNSDMNPEDARSMCCRLRIDNRELVEARRRPLRLQPAHGLHRRRHDQPAAPGLPGRLRRTSSSSASRSSWTTPRRASRSSERSWSLHGRQPLPLHEALPARHQGAHGQLLEEPLLHDRARRA